MPTTPGGTSRSSSGKTRKFRSDKRVTRMGPGPRSARLVDGGPDQVVAEGQEPLRVVAGEILPLQEAGPAVADGVAGRQVGHPGGGVEEGRLEAEPEGVAGGRGRPAVVEEAPGLRIGAVDEEPGHGAVGHLRGPLDDGRLQ